MDEKTGCSDPRTVDGFPADAQSAFARVLPHRLGFTEIKRR